MFDRRRNDARTAANKYAPTPQSSHLMYGIVAILLLAIVLWVVSEFYGLKLFRYPISLAVAVVVIFIGGILLRILRKRRHEAAFDDEYQRGNDRDTTTKR